MKDISMRQPYAQESKRFKPSENKLAVAQSESY